MEIIKRWMLRHKLHISKATELLHTLIHNPWPTGCREIASSWIQWSTYKRSGTNASEAERIRPRWAISYLSGFNLNVPKFSRSAPLPYPTPHQSSKKKSTLKQITLATFSVFASHSQDTKRLWKLEYRANRAKIKNRIREIEFCG